MEVANPAIYNLWIGGLYKQLYCISNIFLGFFIG